ncbi:MAG: antibiotic biosynthesis monooxygenase [Gammaproteobacteria bacterium]
MVLEVAISDVKPHEAEQFEAAFRQVQSIISAMPGYANHQLQRCIEDRNRFILLINWESRANHTVGFRGSSYYQQWKSLLHDFYDPFPQVQHYESVAGAPASG